MKKILIGLSIIGSCIALNSCNDFLDMTPKDSVSDKMIWSTVETAEYAVNNFYDYLYSVSANQCFAGNSDALTDQMKYGSYNYNSLCYIPSEIAYGGSTLTNGYVSTYLGRWSTDYSLILNVNQGIDNLGKYGTGISSEDATRLRAEMRFVRAFLYFDLLKRYKEVILYDEDLSKISKNKDVNTEEEGWDMVQEDLNYAAANLPTKANAGGRIDRGMAYAFLTRAMLYAKRYDAVIAAAEAVQSLGYALESKYSDAIMKEVSAGNKEAILQYQFSLANNIYHSYDYYYTPGGDYSILGNTGGGYGTPTQEMVESYEYAAGGFPDWSAWHTTSGTTEEPPYSELEPRFQASILYNGASWKDRTIEPYVGGTDGFCNWRTEVSPAGRTTTGYYLRKGVDEDHNLTERSASIQPYNIIRYAEVLLNYAEACYFQNNAAGANAAIKQIRSRVGLPYSDLSGDKLWAQIRQERKVELAFEEFSYWDMRRWNLAAGDYPDGLNGHELHGLKIEATANEGQFLYTYVSVDDQARNFPSKMYRFPLPESELESNSSITQYPEWN